MSRNRRPGAGVPRPALLRRSIWHPEQRERTAVAHAGYERLPESCERDRAQRHGVPESSLPERDVPMLACFEGFAGRVHPSRLARTVVYCDAPVWHSSQRVRLPAAVLVLTRVVSQPRAGLSPAMLDG